MLLYRWSSAHICVAVWGRETVGGLFLTWLEGIATPTTGYAQTQHVIIEVITKWSFTCFKIDCVWLYWNSILVHRVFPCEWFFQTVFLDVDVRFLCLFVQCSHCLFLCFFPFLGPCFVSVLTHVCGYLAVPMLDKRLLV